MSENKKGPARSFFIDGKRDGKIDKVIPFMYNQVIKGGEAWQQRVF